MLNVLRPSFEVVREGRIKKNQAHTRPMKVSFCLVLTGLTQNQEVTTSKIVTFFFGPSPEANWRCQFDQDADRKRQHLVPGFGENGVILR